MSRRKKDPLRPLSDAERLALTSPDVSNFSPRLGRRIILGRIGLCRTSDYKLNQDLIH
jgi:hypothetical protein